ncbi:mitochondrial carrier domain-containing protein [Paraphysoderma sedebokerense]|nr:mitochondrial carrier domain-containing protein [Paraphysoderma sedebokerense]
MLGYLPNWAIYFTCYDNLKTRIGHWFQMHGDASDSNMKGDGGRDSSIVHILSAMGAGCVSTTLTNPFWVIKTRFMTQSNESAFRYHSIRHAIKTIYQTEGLRGFYKGLVPSLWGISHVAVQFPLYEKLKVYFRNRHSQGNLYNSSEMYDSQSTVPSSTSTTIMTTTHAVPNRPRAEPLATSDILLASCLSKMAASIATYPHEVIRTRLQNQTYTPSSLSPNSVTPPSSVSAQKFQPNTVNFTNIKQQQPSPTRPRYTSIIHCVKTIYRTESITAFYNGLSTNLLRTVPSSAVTLFTYEKLSRALKEWAEE